MESFCRGCLSKYDQVELIQYNEKNRRLFLYSTGLQVIYKMITSIFFFFKFFVRLKSKSLYVIVLRYIFYSDGWLCYYVTFTLYYYLNYIFKNFRWKEMILLHSNFVKTVSWTWRRHVILRRLVETQTKNSRAIWSWRNLVTM